MQGPPPGHHQNGYGDRKRRRSSSPGRGGMMGPGQPRPAASSAGGPGGYYGHGYVPNFQQQQQPAPYFPNGLPPGPAAYREYNFAPFPAAQFPTGPAAGGYGHNYQPHYRPQQPPRRDPPPEELPYLVPFRQFADYHLALDSTLLDEKLDDMYRLYKIDYSKRGTRKLFREMNDKSWFLEKYGLGEHEQARTERRKKGREGRLQSWLAKENTNPDFDVKDPNEPGTPPPTTTTAPAEDESNADKVKKDDQASTSKDKPNGGTASSKSDQQEHQVEASERKLFIKSIPVDVSRKQLEEICTDLSGFEYLALSEINLSQRATRRGWIRFASANDADAALEKLADAKVGSFALQPAKALDKLQGKRLVVPATFATPARVTNDLEQVKLLATRFEKELGDEKESGTKHIEERYPEEESDAITNKQKLDLYLDYLREVFHTCYYCQASHDFHEELTNRCAVHLRASEDEIRTPAQKQSDANFVKAFDERLPLLVDPANVDPRDHGGKSVDDELVHIVQPHVKEEEEGKYRCRECNKLFSAQKFVVKHVATKHPQLVGDKLDDVKLFNNFILDPARLVPREDEAGRGPLPGHGQQPSRPLSERMDNNRNGPTPSKRRRDDRYANHGPPPPPPAGASIDPRAKRGARDYADLDGAPAGAADVTELPY